MEQWRKDYEQASFKGKGFGLSSSNMNSVKIMDENKGSLMSIEDKINAAYGRTKSQVTSSRPSIYSIEAFVVGNNYKKDRDDLIKVLASPEPGLLVHPLYGKVRVNCVEYTVGEHWEKGGMATFSITFEEAPPEKKDAPKDNLKGKIEQIEESTEAQSLKQFKDTVNQSWVDKAGEFLDGWETIIRNIKKAGQEIALGALKIQQLKNKLEDVVNSPLDLLKNLSNVLRIADVAVLPPRDLFKAYKDADEIIEEFKDRVLSINGRLSKSDAGFYLFMKTSILTAKSKTIVTSVQKRGREIERQRFNQAVEKSSFGQGIIEKRTPRLPIGDEEIVITREDVIDQRNTLLKEIQVLLQDPSIPADVYMEISNLKLAIFEGLPTEAEKFPSMRYVKAKDENILTICYRELGDSTPSESLININRVSHPAFINQDLEVFNVWG